MSTDSIVFESVVSTSKLPTRLKQFYNRTVVFEFYGGIDPIACDLDYLYSETKQSLLYTAKNLDKGNNEVFATDRLSTMRGEKKYRFLEVIKDLDLKYGIKHEYYKNIYGQWIDMGTIRPHFATAKPQNNIFRSLITSEIDNNYKGTSIYKKIGDHEIFQPNLSNNWINLCVIKDLSVIPACKYYVKDPDDNAALVYNITRGDGTYKIDKIYPKTFMCDNNVVNDLVHTDNVKFTYKLADKSTDLIGSGSYDNNNHHKCEDLLLTFTNTDGTPYTDLTNMLIFVNGMVVNYSSANNPNEIYLENVVRYAAYQLTGLKPGYTAENDIEYTEDNLGNRILNYEIPQEEKGYSYEFDIKIFKWDGITISKFEEPLGNTSLLKTEPTEEYASIWLVNGLNFSSVIDKNKCLLLCGNEIMSKDSWDVDPKDSNHVILKHVNAEFDILYSEVYRRLRLYLAEQVEHSLADAPKISDFLTDDISSFEQVNHAMQLYSAAIENYIENGGEYNYHYTQSALMITANQFLNRQYAIVKFDTDDVYSYDCVVSENHDELHFNQPVRNKMINENFTPDDIVIVNGIKHHFLNCYENVFEPVPKWYLLNTNGVFDDVNGYKLEVGKVYAESNRYMKLNLTQLSYGLNPNQTYYKYDKESNKYIPLDNLTEFDCEYSRLNSVELSLGPKKGEVYYTNNGTTFVKVSSSLTSFENDVIYYRLIANEDYYVKIS